LVEQRHRQRLHQLLTLVRSALRSMSDMAMVMLAMAGVALVIAACWQLTCRAPFDAIDFLARLAASFIGAAVLAALLYGLVFTIGMANIAGGRIDLDGYLKAFFWISIVAAFAIAASRR
jgi:hypothetical protein